MRSVTLAAVAALIVPGHSYAQSAATQLDTPPAPPAKTGDPVLDRLNALEARIRQLESRNAELEAQATQTDTRVKNVEVRVSKAVQPGVSPTFSDVNGTFTFKPRGMLQMDYAAYNERAGGYEFSSGTDMRRARFGFEGTAFKAFKWKVDAEYVKQSVNLLDAYVSYAINPKWAITAGQHKTPQGLEANTSDTVNTFMERSMGVNVFGAIGAERRVGLSLAYTSKRLNATAGVFGGAEGVTRNADTAASVVVSGGVPSVKPGTTGTHDEPYSFNGRVTWDPVSDTGRNVHLGVSGYHVSHLAGNAVTLSDRPNVRVDGGNLISVAIAGAAPTATTGATGVKSGDYIGAEGAVVYGRFSVQGEYGALALHRYAGAPTLNFSGFNVAGSVLLTGESRSFKNGNVDKLKPFHDFAPGAGHWGAFELAARYDQLDLDDPALLTLAGRKAHIWTGALNWYLNTNMRATINYIRFTGRNSGLLAPTSTGTAQIGTAKGDALATRLQFDF